jgi:hypothetical protein
VLELRIELTGDWDEARSVLRRGPLLVRRAMDEVLQAEARHAADVMGQALENGGPEGRKTRPLKPLTLLARRLAGIRGDAPLYATRTMRRAMVVNRIPRGYFAGVPSLRYRGRDLARIAKVHEYGAGPYLVKMTLKMRRFLFGVLFKDRPVGRRSRGGKAGYIMVRIPARPFVRPVARREFAMSRLVPRVGRAFMRATRGRLGRT